MNPVQCCYDELVDVDSERMKGRFVYWNEGHESTTIPISLRASVFYVYFDKDSCFHSQLAVIELWIQLMRVAFLRPSTPFLFVIVINVASQFCGV
jgi:hypothetical protein